MVHNDSLNKFTLGSGVKPQESSSRRKHDKPFDSSNNQDPIHNDFWEVATPIVLADSDVTPKLQKPDLYLQRKYRFCFDESCIGVGNFSKN